MTDMVNHAAERAVVAMALTSTGRVSDAILDRVSPTDLDDPTARAILTAVAELRGNGADPDPRAVCERLRVSGHLDLVGGQTGLDTLSVEAPASGALRQICDDVARLARDRRRLSAAQMLVHAAQDAQDEQRWEEAIARLHDSDATSRSAGGWMSPHDIASELVDSLEGGDTTRWPWPLQHLNRLAGGGARRGQLTFIGGASSHGKSAFVDCAQQTMARAGARSALFLNEMTAVERAERIASNLASVRYSRIQRATAGLVDLTSQESQAIVRAMADQPVAMVPCAGWSVEQIVREARRRRLEVMALDIVQKLPFQPGVKRHQTLEDAVQRLDAYAKDSGCHVILVGQINRARASDTFPVPGLPDIKDCAELGNGPDNVLFVWREQDAQTKDPLDEGVIRMAKYRGARLETLPARFTGEFQRWEERLLVAGEQAA
jgi:replicative DNA helicase